MRMVLLFVACCHCTLIVGTDTRTVANDASSEASDAPSTCDASCDDKHN
jgi:hypothetical protein